MFDTHAIFLYVLDSSRPTYKCVLRSIVSGRPDSEPRSRQSFITKRGFNGRGLTTGLPSEGNDNDPGDGASDTGCSAVIYGADGV
jgi:hypothetical protein